MGARGGRAAITGAAIALLRGAAACSGTDAGPDGGRDTGAEASKTSDGAREASELDGGADAAVDGPAPRDATLHDAAEGAPPDAPDAPDATPEGDAGPVFLTALSLAHVDHHDASVPVAIVPSFSPSIHDYFVQCGSGENRYDVTMTAAAGSTSALTSPTTSPALPTQTVRAVVLEDQAVVAVAASGGITVPYWVRCLPPDFPTMLFATHPEAGAPTPGYYLLGNQATGGGASGYAMILDVNGVPVWYERNAGGGVFIDVDDVVSGAISYLLEPQTPGQIGIHALRANTTSYVAPTEPVEISRHELQVLKNGHYLVFVPPNRTGVDMRGVSVTLSDGGSQPLGRDTVIQDAWVVEFDDTGKVYWTWVASKHIDVALETVVPLIAGVQPDGGLVIDPIHGNSIDIDPENENLLVSARNTDAVYYVERPSGKVLWKLGGKPYAKDGAVVVTPDDPFHEQHDARLQPGWSSACGGGAGQVSVFDDESVPLNPARGVVYDVSIGGPSVGDAGADCGVGDGGPRATRAFQYVGSQSSVEMGSFRILADGSRVVGWGVGNAPTLVFTESNAAGADVLDFYFTQGFGSYRAIKVPLTTFDLEVLRQTAGSP